MFDSERDLFSAEESVRIESIGCFKSLIIATKLLAKELNYPNIGNIIPITFHGFPTIGPVIENKLTTVMDLSTIVDINDINEGNSEEIAMEMNYLYFSTTNYVTEE